jgi:hypothetical protein
MGCRRSAQAVFVFSTVSPRIDNGPVVTHVVDVELSTADLNPSSFGLEDEAPRPILMQRTHARTAQFTGGVGG